VHLQKPFKNTNERQYSSFRRSQPPPTEAKQAASDERAQPGTGSETRVLSMCEK
jgi:hypothetical protein